MESGGFVIYLISLIIGLVIWYFLNRGSVRANKQIELLESIDKKLTKIINNSDESQFEDRSSNGLLQKAREELNSRSVK